MNSSEIFREIRDFCLQHADPKIIQKYSRYFREGYQAYGVAQEVQDLKVKELNMRKDMDLTAVLQLSRLLIPGGIYEEVNFAVLLLEKQKRYFSHDLLNELDWWFKNGIENWAHADIIGGHILGHLVLKELIRVEDFNSWLVSDRKYQRRVVPVAFLKRIKKKENIPDLLLFLGPLMNDNERVVHQGMGWFLRECWKIDSQPVELYLMKYRNTAARLIFQYATEKMDKEYRKKFRRDKI